MKFIIAERLILIYILNIIQDNILLSHLFSLLMKAGFEPSA